MSLWKVCRTYKKAEHIKWQIFWTLDNKSISFKALNLNAKGSGMMEQKNLRFKVG